MPRFLKFDATDQIREVLIHPHYLSQKDIEICLDFDLARIADRPEIDSIRTLHAALKSDMGQTMNTVRYNKAYR